MISSISNWILSITGIVCLSVITELILPAGKLTKYIKGVFSFIMVLVIILPLPKLLGREINISNIFSFDNTYQIDSDYIYQLNLNKLDSLQKDICNKAEEQGYLNVKVYIDADITNSNMKIEKINVDLTNLIITENSEHKDIQKIKKHISQIIYSLTNTDQELILYDR